MYNDLTKKVNKLADDLAKDGKEPQKIYQDYRELNFKIDLVQKENLNILI